MSGVKDGHFTVTPELQAAALSCFTTYAVFLLGKDKVMEILETIKGVDERFPIVVGSMLEAVNQQMGELLASGEGGEDE